MELLMPRTRCTTGISEADLGGANAVEVVLEGDEAKAWHFFLNGLEVLLEGDSEELARGQPCLTPSW
jgi:hypothetical protein